MAVSTIDPNGLNVGQLGGDRNLLINGDFQISQRGNYTSAFSYTNNTYYLDRWIGSLGGVTATLQDIGRKVKLVATSSATGTMRLIQKIELSTMNKFNSQTVIASAKVKSNSSQARIGFYADGYIVPTGNTTHTGDETEQTLTAIITVPSSTLTVEFDVFVGLQGANAGDTVSITSGDYVEITEVQLEVGDTATDFEYESYGTTLQKCLRYYEVVDLYEMVSTYIGSGKNQHYLTLFYKETKRASPTIGSVSIGNYQPGGGSGTAQLEGNALSTHCRVATGSTNSSIPVQIINSPSANMTIDAEL